MARPFIAVAIAACCAMPVAASREADFSDLWWNAGESGWGVGLQRQGDVIFLTLFVYGADGRPTWFVAPDLRLQPGDGDAPAWSGALLRTLGPGFGGAFDPGSVEGTVVGSARLEFSDAYRGVLTYSVGGTQVSKAITRMTWRQPSPEGRYHGGFTSAVASCADTPRIGRYDFLGPMRVSRDGDRFVAQVTSDRAGLLSSCTFDGQIQPQGRLSSWSGAFNCTVVIGFDERGENVSRVNRNGPFVVERMEITENAVHGDLAASDQDCAFSGRFGGTRMP